jgi:hypothetical protein
MTKIAETYFRLAIRLDRRDRIELSSYLNDHAIEYAAGLFAQKPEFIIRIEEGTIKGWVTVAGVIAIAISQYGSFRSGLDYLIHDARAFSERVRDDICGSGLTRNEIIRFERRLGVPGKLSRVMQRFDYLDAHATTMSPKEYRESLTAAKRELQEIIGLIDDEAERECVLEGLKSSLPPRLPLNDQGPEPRVGLNPEPKRIMGVPRDFTLEPPEPMQHFLPKNGGACSAGVCL